MCYYMQPYFGFDVQKNAMVLFLDRYGISLINLKSQEVHQILNYEDQAYYFRKPPAEVKWSPKKVLDDKNRPVNIDMWQKYNDCILCD